MRKRELSEKLNDIVKGYYNTNNDIGIILLDVVKDHIMSMEVFIDIDKFKDSNGNSITKKQYGEILITELCSQIK